MNIHKALVTALDTPGMLKILWAGVSYLKIIIMNQYTII